MTAKQHYVRKIVKRTIQAKNYRLGQLITEPQSNPYGCPVCVRSTETGSHRVKIYDYGVQFACGCIVDLPAIHRGTDEMLSCMWCNPKLATVSGLHRKSVA